MSEFIYKERTERNLPHYHPPRATLFVTFRLADTIPQSELRIYKAQKGTWDEKTKCIEARESEFQEFRRNWFAKFEDILHRANNGPTWLKDDQVAKIVADALLCRDGDVYRLDAYCIMSNHVHVVFAPSLSEEELREVSLPEGLRFVSKNPPLDAIMKSLKGYTAWGANRALGRKGTFWEEESYDHVVRDGAEFDRIVNYVLNNPVKAGLVKDWQEWKWSYRRKSQHM